MGRLWRVLALLLVTGCIRDNSVDCGDYACPSGLVCTRGGCSTAEQAAACADHPDGDVCTTSDVLDGTCVSGTCHAQICGDGVVERGEACDDGNDLPGDGCSGDCRSTEVCGNGIVDGVVGEQCDVGIAGLSGDGCTSRCSEEFAIWRDATPKESIGVTQGALAYDAGRKVVIAFGGEDSAGCSNVTREGDVDGWRTRRPAVSPPPRRGHVLVYDAARRRTVLFGGLDCPSSQPLGDTWEWDGVTWTAMHPNASPPPRSSAGAVYDGQHVVVFGGAAGVTRKNDVWDYDGTTWTERTTSAGPAGRANVAMAYDPVRSRIVVFGGTLTGGLAGDTWELAGATWSFKNVAGPSPRSDATASFDGAAIMLFGGDDGAQRNDTWIWNGIGWSTVSSVGPGPRAGAATAFDPRRGLVVLTGSDPADAPAETWVWNGVAWSNASVTRSPNPRFFSPLVFDALRGETVGFGGSPGQFGIDETWLWTGSEWIRRNPVTRPSRRGSVGLAYDRRLARTVMFGGQFRGPLFRVIHLADTWSWDGATWADVTPAQSPPARSSPLVYDSARDRIVMFGGGGNAVNGEAALGDTWEWDGLVWTERTPLHHPAARINHVLTYDSHRQRAVLFGGDDLTDLLSDTWEWDGTDWTQIVTAVAPPVGGTLAATYDPVREDTVVVTGGQVWDWNGTEWRFRFTVTQPPSSGAVTYDALRRALVLYDGLSTFVLDFEPVDNAPIERCFYPAADDDLDKLAGCADPDCWARCSPLCPPGDTCGAGQPRCGDGACGPVEDYLICPSDCAAP